MKGIKRRVTIGFISIALLLFFSGMVSFFELNTLSDDTEYILKSNRRNLELARDMLSAAHQQNTAFVNITAFKNLKYDSLCMKSIENLESTLAVAHEEAISKIHVDSMQVHLAQIRQLSEQSISTMSLPDSLISIEVEKQLYKSYLPIYDSFVTEIQSYMTLAQLTIEPRAEQLHRNAYRAVTPVFIALVVMIATVLMLFYFMIIYCVNPIIAMNRALGETLSFKLPFNVKAQCQDEMLELKEKIEQLTLQAKRNSKN